METYEPISKTLGRISDEKHKVSFLCVYFCRLFCFFDIRIFIMLWVTSALVLFDTEEKCFIL